MAFHPTGVHSSVQKLLNQGFWISNVIFLEKKNLNASINIKVDSQNIGNFVIFIVYAVFVSNFIILAVCFVQSVHRFIIACTFKIEEFINDSSCLFFP